MYYAYAYDAYDADDADDADDDDDYACQPLTKARTRITALTLRTVASYIHVHIYIYIHRYIHLFPLRSNSRITTWIIIRGLLPAG